MRKYTVQEMVDMRGWIGTIASEGKGSAYVAAADIEDQLRSYMANGTEPDELREEAAFWRDVWAEQCRELNRIAAINRSSWGEAQLISMQHNQYDDDPLDPAMLAAASGRLRNNMHALILRKFLAAQAMGLTKAKLARRLRKRPELITRLLSQPSNMELSTVAELLVGISAEELDPESSPITNRSNRATHT